MLERRRRLPGQLGSIGRERDEYELPPVGAERCDERRERGVVADDRAAAGRPREGRAERWILTQDGALELLQHRARLDPELVHQQPSAFAVAGERLRLPSAAVEREHQLPPRLLAQRLLLHERLQLADETLVPAELELRFDPLAERLQPQLGQPPRGRDRERLAPELVQGGAAPEREGIAVQLSAPSGAAAPGGR